MVVRFDVYLVNLDSEPSRDAKNTRPCVVISPDEMNRNVRNVIIAPLSSTLNYYPTRVMTDFLNGQRAIVLDQLRTVDKSRLVKKIGSISGITQTETLEKLREMFEK